jgi:Beta protein
MEFVRCGHERSDKSGRRTIQAASGGSDASEKAGRGQTEGRGLMNKNFDLDELSYIPALRSRQAELRGYRELRPETKQKLRPIISIGRHSRVSECARIAERVIEAVAGPFFIDLNTFPDQQCDEWQALVSPDDNFRAWRDFGASIDGAVPVALIRDGAPERAFVRQVLALETAHGLVTIRTRRPASDLSLLQAAIAAVEDVNNVLIVLDMGYIRAALEAKEVEASRAINALRSVDPTVRIALVSSSFPRALAAFGEESGRLDILERDLHARLGGSEVSIYGDHAAIYPEPFETSAARWVPRIDYATFDAWHFRRHRADDGGFSQCAREIVNLPDWDAGFAEETWGAGIILQQSRAAEPLPSFGSPAPWISVRVNTHIERQAEAGPADYDDDGEE